MVKEEEEETGSGRRLDLLGTLPPAAAAECAVL
jgi:hypothetical protein